MLAFLAAHPKKQVERKSLARGLFEVDSLPTDSNLTLLLSRAHSTLAGISEVPLIEVSNGRVALVKENCDCDLDEFHELSLKARANEDPIGAAMLWLEALQIASARPFLDLDSPLLTPVAARISASVLEAAVGLACGPLGRQHGSLILDRFDEFEILEHLESKTIGNVMRVYAALGLKDELVSTFTAFESRLDYEWGESPTGELTQLFESLMADLDRRKRPTCGVAPVRPEATFGRRETLDAILRAVLGPDTARLITITGQCGIGKSHLLRLLFHELVANRSTAHFDLETQPLEVMERLLTENPCDVVLVDHIHPKQMSAVRRLMDLLPTMTVICASPSRLQMANEVIVTLPPLALGSVEDPGPAIELIERSGRLVQSPSEQDWIDTRMLLELADLCDGVPFALEIAGRLVGSTGVAATVGSLRREVDGLTGDRHIDHRQSSLRSAVSSSYGNLSGEAKKLVSLLAEVGLPCHVDMLLSCSDSVPCDLEEAILAGLVVHGADPSRIRVPRSVTEIVGGLKFLEASVVDRFCDQSAEWFVRKAAERPIDLTIAESVLVGIKLARHLADRSRDLLSLKLISSLRPWLGSVQLQSNHLGDIIQVLMRPSPMTLDGWAEAVLAAGAAYFHAGRYEDMAKTSKAGLDWAQTRLISADIRCQLHVQAALAARLQGCHDEAIEGYRRAAAMADGSVSPATLVKCYYNLGSLLESQQRLDEALEAQVAAADYFSEETDTRVETLVNTSIGRLTFRVGGDLDSARLILEATLAHARQRSDARSMAEVLQNLGLVCWANGMYQRAAEAELEGTSLLLTFGYVEEFRRLSKSSFVTICACLFELGLDDTARAVRTLIDRLGPADLYAPNQSIFDLIVARTYRPPPGLKVALATESEVRDHLKACQAALGTLADASQRSSSAERLNRTLTS